MITVKVGEDAKPFVIHRALICAHSKFFRNAFTGPFAEAQDREIKLAEVNTDLFMWFTNWLYFSSFDFGASTEVDKPDKANSKQPSLTERWNYLLDMYIFGEKYDCSHSRRAVLIQWQELELKDVGQLDISIGLLRKMFSELPETCPLCQEVAALCAVRLGFLDFKSEALFAAF